MNVALCFVPNINTGVGIYSIGLIRALSDIIGPSDQLEAFVQLHRARRPEWLPDAVTYRRPRVYGRLQETCQRLAVPVESVLGIRADIVHMLNPERVHTRVPLVVTVHDVMWRVMGREAQSIVDSKWIRYAERTITAADHILADSAFTADALVLGGVDRRRVTVVHLGVDEEFRRVDATETIVRIKYSLPEQYFLHVGAINVRKNVATLARALARLRHCPTLVCVGPTPPEGLEYWGLRGPATRHLGTVPREDLPGLISQSCGLIFPSMLEGFGLPLIEALACGVPVLASDIPVFRELAGDAPMYFDPLDELSIARAVQHVVQGGVDYRASVSDLHRQVAAKYSWQACAEGTLETYRSVLTNTRKRP